MKNVVLTMALFLCLSTKAVYAECYGKADLGAVFLRADVIQSGKTVESLDMGGIRGDATVLVYNGFCFKPSFILARGKDEGRLYTASLGVGHYFPVNKEICLVPSLGVNISELKSELRTKLFGMVFKNKEKFRSGSFYIGLDATYSVGDSLLFTGVIQYAWARTNTHVEDQFNSNGHSQGLNLGVLVDYYLTKCWSINAGFGYNNSLSKEKHGLRVIGGKVGVAYWF